MDTNFQNNNQGNNQNFNPSTSSGDKNPKKSKYWKFILGFLGIVLLGFVVFPITYNYYKDYETEKGFENYFEAEKGYLDALKNDTFGGKTPQETYEMFIATLKGGNILDAAKFYYYDSDRIRAYERFEKMQKDGSLENWITELPNWSKMKEVEYWDPDGREFEYEYVREEDEKYYDELMKEWDIIPAGKYQADIIFHLNKSANIWKINEF